MINKTFYFSLNVISYYRQPTITRIANESTLYACESALPNAHAYKVFKVQLYKNIARALL